VLSLYVDWNPRNSGAARAAAAITAEKYCADHEILPWGANWIAYLPRLRGWGHPYTNILGLTIGAAYARYREASAVASGVRPESSNGPRWRAAMNELLHASALSGSLDLLLPVYDLTDNAIIANAIALGVDLDTTHSCSQSEPPCGRCRSCQRHARAVAALK
jgi:7-cyano-7-deazaguanine synthase in queuosine biosynthesis